MNILTIIDTDRNRFEWQTLQKKNKKMANARKNSNATAHCTHLPLPATAQANPKAKSKECNRQRFVRLRNKMTYQNHTFDC